MKTLLTTTALCAGLIAGTAQAETWNMQSTYPGSLAQLGTLGKRIAEQVTQITDGEIELVFQEPGASYPRWKCSTRSAPAPSKQAGRPPVTGPARACAATSGRCALRPAGR